MEKFLLLLPLLINLFTAPLYAANCPAEDAHHKYLDVLVDINKPEIGTYKLHYKLQNGFTLEKKTIFLLHGGPGEGMGAFDICKGSYCFSELSDKYNIVTIDERGAGCSIFPESLSYDYLNIENSANDIEELRNYLVGPDEKISMFGTSFGTILGMVYASNYNDKLEKLILEGAVYDYKYLINGAWNENLDRVFSLNPDLTKEKLNYVIEKYFNNDINRFYSTISVFLKSYNASVIIIPKMINFLLSYNGPTNEWRAQFYSMLPHLPDGYVPPVLDENNFAFKYIFCREPFKSSNDSFTKFESNNYLKNIRVPTLIITGGWDSVVPAEHNAKQIHERQTNSLYFVIPFVSHGVMWHNRNCDIAMISAFLDRGLTNELGEIFESAVCKK